MRRVSKADYSKTLLSMFEPQVNYIIFYINVHGRQNVALQIKDTISRHAIFIISVLRQVIPIGKPVSNQRVPLATTNANQLGLR